MNIGNILARFAAEGARTGKVTAWMCSGCAFKKGTPANGEQDAAENALEALLTDNVQFNCHRTGGPAATRPTLWRLYTG